MAKYEFKVLVEPAYLPDRSEPLKDYYVFAYTVTIVNTGDIAAQLISRHWIITDGHLHVEDVKGLGVVGAQPLLQPGEQYKYTSGAVLTTPKGTMRGAYLCVAEDGEQFYAEIPEFILEPLHVLH